MQLALGVSDFKSCVPAHQCISSYRAKGKMVGRKRERGGREREETRGARAEERERKERSRGARKEEREKERVKKRKKEKDV